MSKSTPEELSKLNEDQQQCDQEVVARHTHRTRVTVTKALLPSVKNVEILTTPDAPEPATGEWAIPKAVVEKLRED